jgi:single-stranded-DNA-specific exonuclease
MRKWNIQYKSPLTDSDDLIKILLKNRGLEEKADIANFLEPKLKDVTVDSVGLDPKHLKKAVKRVNDAITRDERIIVFGDYDVDGICGSTIMWETLYEDHKKTMPYIPHRMDEGYGLSVKAIDNILIKYPETKLIITVDNGVVAHDAVNYANTKKIDVIITDHHVGSTDFPDAYAVVHTTKLCGAGVAWLFTQQLGKKSPELVENHLELAAIATIADLVPLTDGNRTIVKEGLRCIQRTTRVGLLELYKDALVEKEKIGVYEIGHIICPRINAMGRLTSGMDSLRLLCAKNHLRAAELAKILSTTNRDRQSMTTESALHAIDHLSKSIKASRIAFVAHEDYNQGVIGLIASKLVEEYYKPSFAIAIGEKVSKGSARSISGVNIIEMIRSVGDTVMQAGGHPMAAGFTVETSRLEEFRLALVGKAKDLVTDDHLVRSLKIDLVISLSAITTKLYKAIQELAPFGIGNPEPLFVSIGVTVEDAMPVGREKKHLKLKVSGDGKTFDAIAFGLGEMGSDLKVGSLIDIAFTIDENTWQGKTKLQLKVKDIKISNSN